MLSAYRFNFPPVHGRAWASFPTKREIAPNFQNLRFLQDGEGVSLPEQCSPSIYHVFCILFLGSRVGMFWIYALRSVATVKKIFSFRDYSFEQLPSYAVCAKPLGMRVVPNESVMMSRAPVCDSSANPNPAFSETWLRRVYRAVLIHLVPKSFREWNFDELAFAVYLHTGKSILRGITSQGVRV
jgi:hypothetical protein